MASLIAGRDTPQSKPAGYVTASASQYVGMAPDARVVNVKVAAADGGADVSQVIAAINWVTQHAHDPGMNIRVLSLSYGTQSTQAYTLDPLCYAVEQAWKEGITVVVAGGNDGVTTTTSLADPAMDPFVLAVGADDPQGTVRSTDDTVPTFATHGTRQRHVDLVAPAVHVLGLRVPGGTVDLNNPSARVGTRFLRGSGTSQATAIVAGAVADVLQKYPSMTPDLVKATLMQGAVTFAESSATYRGSGLLDVGHALNGGGSNGNQSNPAATGTGSLEQARGGSHVVDPDTGSLLTGEQDIFGKPFTSGAWAQLAASGTAWDGGSWNGSLWTGDTATTTGWSLVPWGSAGWDSHSWTSHSWTSHSWTAEGWDSHSWTDSAWDSHSWTSAGWDSHSWTGAGWSSGSWS
jgi:serine protease AprX